MTGEGGESYRDSEKQFWGDVEAAAQAFDVVPVELALAAENLGDDAGSAEDIGEVFLQEAVLVHKEVEDFERLGAGQMVVAVFEILDQEECIESTQK
jgi:hypothetical protein